MQTLIALLVVLVLIQSMAGQTLVSADQDAREQVLSRVDDLEQLQRYAQAINELQDLIRRGSAHPEDLARVGELLEASGRGAEAGDWFKKAVQQAGTTANDIPTNVHAIYGRWLWGEHEFQSAIPELLAALKHPGQPEKRWTLYGLLAQAYQGTGDREDAFLAFANAYFSNPYQISIWRDVNAALTDRNIISAALVGEHSVSPPPAPDLFLRVAAAGAWDNWDPDHFEDSAKLFMSYADALEGQGLAKDAKTFRTLAAMGALKTGMRAVRARRPDKGLQCFAFAEGIVPLDKFKLDVQVTVLRDMALAYGSRGELTHAMATAERLIPMCKPDNGSQPCTLDGIASVPFPSNYDQNRDPRADGFDQVTELHLKIVARLLLEAFESVSFDPLSGALRTDATPLDFVGFSIKVDKNGTKRKQPYGIVSAEEDRVEFQRILLSERDTLQRRALESLSKGGCKLVIKALLIDLSFTSMLGVPIIPETALTGKFFDMPLKEISDRVETASSSGKLSQSSHMAFEVALCAIRLYGEMASWREVEAQLCLAKIENAPLVEDIADMHRLNLKITEY